MTGEQANEPTEKSPLLLDAGTALNLGRSSTFHHQHHWHHWHHFASSSSARAAPLRDCISSKAHVFEITVLSGRLTVPQSSQSRLRSLFLGSYPMFLVCVAYPSTSCSSLHALPLFRSPQHSLSHILSAFSNFPRLLYAISLRFSEFSINTGQHKAGKKSTQKGFMIRIWERD